MKSLTTIFADASFCHKSKAGGWAAWIVSDRYPRRTVSGQFKTALAESGEAELLALANALYVATTSGYVARTSCVLLQSDCQYALTAVRWAVPDCEHSPFQRNRVYVPKKDVVRTDTARQATALIARLANDLQLELKVRHVRGHRNGGGRHWVNNECDRLAKEQMNKARSIL